MSNVSVSLRLRPIRFAFLVRPDDAKRTLEIFRFNTCLWADSGITLLTEELYWDNELEKVHTDKFVTFITETDSLFGRGFESDRSLNGYKIFNPTGVAHRNTGEK